MRVRLTGIALSLTVFAANAQALETSLVSPGAPDDLVDRLRGASTTLAAEARGRTTPQEILAAARSDYRSLVSVLYDAGYYGPVVHILVDGREAASIPALNTPSRIDSVQITVDPGKPFRFGTAEIGPLAPGTELPEGFKTGEPAPSGVLQAAGKSAIGQWRTTGHAKAGISGQTITARHREGVLDASIRIAPGPQMTFGKASVAGNERVTTDAVRRIAGFPTGEVFSPEAARRTAGRLRRTGAFTSVSMTEAATANADNSLDFALDLVEAPRRRLEFGAEIASTEGLEVSFKWIHRNLFGGAERLTFDTRVRNIGGTSDIDGQLVVRLDRPAYFGTDNDLFYLLNIETRDEDHYWLFKSQIGAGWRRVFSPKLYAEAGIAANYNISDDVFGDDREFTFVSLPGRLRWDRRDSTTNATRGFYLNADVAPFIGVNGTSSGLYTLNEGRFYRGLGADNRVVLAARVQLGSVLGPSIQDISPDLLFYSGGSGTVRGHPLESLGIPIGAGTAGGRSFLGISAEIRTRVTDQFSVVGFYDYGVVGADSFVNANSPSHAGAGLGVRYDVGGIGALRLDAAYPVSGTTGEGWQFYFGIGQTF